MGIDEDRVDQAVLAPLSLPLQDGVRAWIGHDWDAMDRLCKKGFIENPVGKVKSVALTEEGLRASKRLFAEMFRKR